TWRYDYLIHLPSSHSSYIFFPSFFLHDTATTDIYTLSLHDALPIFTDRLQKLQTPSKRTIGWGSVPGLEVTPPLIVREPQDKWQIGRATSELQSRSDLVCRLLLEKKKKKKRTT